MIVAAGLSSTMPGAVHAADPEDYGVRGRDLRSRCDDPRLYYGPPLADYRVPPPGRAREPYYDHGPNWGEDPSTRHPVYGIDPSCYR